MIVCQVEIDPATLSGLRRAALPVQVVQQPVNHNSGHGNVEPERQCPPGNSLVKIEALPPGTKERSDDQGNDNDGKKRVRAEQRKVGVPNRALSGESRDAVMRVVPDVANKKKRGRREGGKHADLVGQDLLTPNEKVAQHQQEGAGGVQRGIESGEVRKLQSQKLSLQLRVDS